MKNRKRTLAATTNSVKRPNPLRIDPSRTITLRRVFAAKINAQFALLKIAVHKFVEDDDAFGLNVIKNASVDQPRDDHGRFAQSVASSVVKDITQKWGEKQGSEEGLSPKDINEGFCSWFAHGAVREIQKRMGRNVGIAGSTNETEHVYTSRTNQDPEGEGHMWVTVHGKHYDPESPEGVSDPKDLKWFERHPGFSIHGRATPLTTNYHEHQLRDSSGVFGPGVGLGLDRDDMSQVKDLEGFLRWAKMQGVSSYVDEIEARNLQPVQTEFRQDRVDAIPDEKLEDPILISKDNRVLDGTHRWVKHWQGHPAAEVPCVILDLDAEKALALIREWPGASYVQNANPHHDEKGKFSSGDEVEIHDNDGEVFWRGKHDEAVKLLKEQEEFEPNHGLQIRAATQQTKDEEHERRDKFDKEASERVVEASRQSSLSTGHGVLPGHKYFVEPPEELYHATFSADVIKKEGFKSGDELGLQVLGGSSSQLTSFTTKENAEYYRDALNTARKAVKGELSTKELVDDIGPKYGVNKERMQQIVESNSDKNDDHFNTFQRMSLEGRKFPLFMGSMWPNTIKKSATAETVSIKSKDAKDVYYNPGEHEWRVGGLKGVTVNASSQESLRTSLSENANPYHDSTGRFATADQEKVHSVLQAKPFGLHPGVVAKQSGIKEKVAKSVLDELTKSGHAVEKGGLYHPSRTMTTTPSPTVPPVTSSPLSSSGKGVTDGVLKAFNELEKGSHGLVSIKDVHEKTGGNNLAKTHEAINDLRKQGVLSGVIYEARNPNASIIAHGIKERDSVIGHVQRRTENYSSDQERDSHGRWGSGSTVGKIVSAMVKLGATVAHIEHVAKSWVIDECEAAVSLLPQRAQSIVKASFFATKLVGGKALNAAFVNFTMGQSMAERVAKERGNTPEQARRLRGILSSVDCKTFELLKVGALSGIHALHIPMAVSATVPVASCAYIAYSTAKNPLATARAAIGVVDDVAKWGKDKLGIKDEKSPYSSFVTHVDEQLTPLMISLTEYDWSDWYIAILHAAIDKTGNLNDAIKLADDACERHPTEGMLNPSDDVNELFGPVTTNARMEDEEFGHWVTTEEGRHLFISGDGTVLPHGPRKLGESTQGKDQHGEQRTGSDSSGSGRVHGVLESGSSQLAETAGGPERQETSGQGHDGSKPVGEGTPQSNPSEGIASKHDHEQLRDVGDVTKRLERFENFFRSKGQHEVADWMGQLKDHVANVGGQAALDALGKAGTPGTTHEVQYWGVATAEDRWHHMGDFIQSYLARNGIHTVIEHSDPKLPLVSAYGKTDKFVASQDFKPNIGSFQNKLDESKSIPGLEKSEDINKLMGKPVTHLTDEVINKLDETHGKGQWIVKAYGDEAAAGYGIFFPQRAQAIRQDAQNTIWQAGEHLDKYGFKLGRNLDGKVFGIIHNSGDIYQFGTHEYDHTIHGDVKNWAEKASVAAHNEHGAMLPDDGKEAQGVVKRASEEMGKHGFSTMRDDKGLIIGIKHEGGNEYPFEGDKFGRVTKSSPNVGGQEHDVHEDADNNKFIKLTKGGHFGQNKDLGEYLDRHRVSNELWPELGYKFHGITQDAEGRPQAVMSMNRVEGTHPEQHEIHQWFDKHGFVPVKEEDKGFKHWDPKDDYLVQSWKDPKTGTIIGDAHSKNFIKTSKGIVPIDVDVIPGKNYEAPNERETRPAGTTVEGGKGSGVGRGSQVSVDDARRAAQIDATKPESGRAPETFIHELNKHGVEGLPEGKGENGRFDHPHEVQSEYNRKVIETAKTSGDFISPNSYNRDIHGDVRTAADKIADVAKHEHLQNTDPNHSLEFMAQPAFKAVGISDAERAAGKTFHATNEGRVHLMVRDGKAEVIPHSTWLKGGNLPVVFENDDTRAMAKAAQDVINQLPEHARKGQVYAPDVMKTPNGYKVVELNPQGDAAGSGYLTDNHFTIDAYTSHLTGREPLHVQFIRNLLTKNKKDKESVEGREVKNSEMPNWWQVLNAQLNKDELEAWAQTVQVAPMGPMYGWEPYMHNSFEDTLTRGPQYHNEPYLTNNANPNHDEKGRFAAGDVVTWKGKKHVVGDAGDVRDDGLIEIKHSTWGRVNVSKSELTPLKKSVDEESKKGVVPKGRIKSSTSDMTGSVDHLSDEELAKTFGIKKHTGKTDKNEVGIGSNKYEEGIHIRGQIKSLEKSSGVDESTVNMIVLPTLFRPFNSTLAGTAIPASVERVLGSPRSAYDKEKESNTKKDECSLKDAKTDVRVNGFTKDRRMVNNATVDKVVKAAYDTTQRLLKEAGIKEITVHRGTYGTEKKETNALESWTLDKGVAEAFSKSGEYAGKKGRVETLTVPASRVFSTPATGFGVASQAEIILLSDKRVNNFETNEGMYGGDEVLEWETWLKNQSHSLINSFIPLFQERVRNAGDFSFATSSDKVLAFQRWLSQQMQSFIIGRTQEDLWRMYAEAGYRKGAGRAFDDAKGVLKGQKALDYYSGTKDEFLRSSFAKPVSVEKVKLLAGRSFDDLENITADMSTRMSRVLTDGLVQGQSPREVARALNKAVDIGSKRALDIAATECIRCHAEGQLDALERLGVEQVGAAVEWGDAGDEKVCERCSTLNGITLTIKEARGKIPLHVRCRCAWLPADIADKTPKGEREQKFDEAGVENVNARDWDFTDDSSSLAKFEQLLSEMPEPLEPLQNIPDHLIQFEIGANAFCPTGEGGGVDATCSPGDVAKNRPSKPEERHENSSPKVLPWKDPPPKKGKKGEGMGERPSGKDSQTAKGDEAEMLATKLGFRSVLPVGKRNLTAKEVEKLGSSIDLEYDHSGKLYELKMCQTTSTEYRLKAKKEEKDAKERFAKTYKATPYTMVAVRDGDARKVHFYAAKEPGLIGAEVSNKKYDYVGSVDIPK